MSTPDAAALRWRRLDAAALEAVYRSEMLRDFPAGELKPLQMILDGEARGMGHSWGVYDGDTLAAYLLMVRPQGLSACLLDYFAVLPAYRASGLGAQLLAALPAQETGADAILIESELPERAEDPAMARRRLGFYARCGARDTGWTEHLFDAWFKILVLDPPGRQPLAGDAAARALMESYRRFLGEVVRGEDARRLLHGAPWKQYVQFFRPDGAEEG